MYFEKGKKVLELSLRKPINIVEIALAKFLESGTLQFSNIQVTQFITSNEGNPWHDFSRLCTAALVEISSYPCFLSPNR